MPLLYFSTYQIEVCDDLIKKPQTFKALVIDVILDPKLFEVGNRSKHHANTFVRLVVELLIN